MKLPEDSHIAPEKLTRYLLVPRARGDKSAFLALGGYTLDNFTTLLTDLRTQILNQDAAALETTSYGQLYEIRAPLVGPSGCTLRVRTIWMTECLSGVTKYMNYTLFTDVALTRDVPAHELRRGDVVRLIDRHAGPDGKVGYSIEVFNAVGDTVAVTVVDEDAIEALQSDEVLSVRRIKSAAA